MFQSLENKAKKQKSRRPLTQSFSGKTVASALYEKLERMWGYKSGFKVTTTSGQEDKLEATITSSNMPAAFSAL